MAKLEYKAECLCGGELKALFKKPTRMQHSVYKTSCSGCKSQFMFTCEISYNDKGRIYVPSHEVVHMTENLREIVKLKKEASTKSQLPTESLALSPNDFNNQHIKPAIEQVFEKGETA